MIRAKIITKAEIYGILRSNLKREFGKGSCIQGMTVTGNKKTGKIVEVIQTDQKTHKETILYRDYNDKLFKHLKPKEKKE